MESRHGAALLGALVAGSVALGITIAPGAAIDRLQSVLFSPWFPLLLVGLYAVRPFLAWPITALSVLVGYRYGLALGVPIALAGAVATSVAPYAAGRYGRDGWLLGWARGATGRFFGATGDLRGVIAARLAPTPAEVISVAAGVGRVSLPAFCLGTAIGELPWTIAAVLAGRSMQELSVSEGIGADPLVLAGGLVGALALVAGPVYRVVRRRTTRSRGENR